MNRLGVRGKFISIIGIDGSGKTTLAQNLGRFLQFSSPTVMALSSDWRRCTDELEVVSGELGKSRRDCFSATFRGSVWALDLVTKVVHLIEPALQQGHTVIVDRYTICNRIYTQLNQADTVVLDKIHSALPEPDLLIFLDLDWEQAWERIGRRGGVISPKEQPKQLRAAAEMYRRQVKEMGSDVLRLDARNSPEQLLEDVVATMEERFGEFC